jgi:hypothetical protein
VPELLKSTNLQYPPTLIFTGATASVKGSALCSAFATGKWALRALSQSLAKEFGPQGLHVGHVIIDGIIDIERTKAYDVGGGKPDAKISPNGVGINSWSSYKISLLILIYRLRMHTGIYILSRGQRSLGKWT